MSFYTDLIKGKKPRTNLDIIAVDAVNEWLFNGPPDELVDERDDVVGLSQSEVEVVKAKVAKISAEVLRQFECS